MDTPQRPQVAQRIDALLRRSLGQGVEPRRLLADPLYARDVLLVCDALAGTEGPALSRLFRSLTAAEAVRAAGGGSERSSESLGDRISGWMSGFGQSTGFGPSEPAREAPGHDTAPRASRWPRFWR